jgi:UDP-glucose 4-epimerase
VLWDKSAPNLPTDLLKFTEQKMLLLRTGQMAKGITSAGHYERMDVTNTQLVRQVIKDYDITTVYHLASLLSELQKSSQFLHGN